MRFLVKEIIIFYQKLQIFQKKIESVILAAAPRLASSSSFLLKSKCGSDQSSFRDKWQGKIYRRVPSADRDVEQLKL
jgi:hypothetical protein